MKEISFKKILVAVSLTEITYKAIPYEKYILQKFDCETHLLFVARIGRDDLLNTPGEAMKIKREVQENAEKKLNEHAQEYFKNEDVITCVKVGDPADEIIDYINNEKIDFVLMGTHGRRGIKKTFLGSVAEDVIKRSPAPVVIINPFRVKS